MPFLCESVEKNPALELSRYHNRFIYTEHPKTPLGDNWKFVPCVVPKTYELYEKQIKNFNVLSNDIWIITFPKSGTTWTQELVSLIVNDLNYKHCREIPLYKRVPFFEFSVFKVSTDGNEDFTNIIERYSLMEKPRCFKTHLPPMLLPSKLWTVKPKIIYVARDPRDAAISFYHHNKHLDEFTGTMDDFLLKFLNGTCGYGPYINHVTEFWEMRNEENILFITYEDMQLDFPKIIKQIAMFLNKEFPDADINKLAKYLSFDSMKNDECFNYNKYTREVMPDQGKINDFNLIRKGKVGAHKEEMSTEFIGKFNKWLMEKFPLFTQIFNKEIL